MSLDNEENMQDGSIRKTESTPSLVDVNSFNNNIGKKIPILIGRSDATKNDGYPASIENSEIKKAIIAACPKQPKGLFPRDPLPNGRSFSTNY